MFKKCRKCGIKKSSDYFHKSKQNKDGLMGICKTCKSIEDLIYRKQNKESIAKKQHEYWLSNTQAKNKNRYFKERHRFGINATEYVKSKSCVHCGITNDEHIIKFGERLQIHHIDNRGRRAMQLKELLNNSLNNFEVVCRACHCRITNKTKDYSKRKNPWITRRLNQKICLK